MRWSTGFLAGIALVAPLHAQTTVGDAPTDLLPPVMRGEAPTPKPAKAKKPKPQPNAAQPEPASAPVPIQLPPSTAAPMPPIITPVLPPAPPPVWSILNAQKLHGIITRIEARGLFPQDYDPDTLQAAINNGEGDALNIIATDLFTRLASDLRDGRTPRSARLQWLIKDDDATNLPIRPALDEALKTGEIGETLAALEPDHPDYVRLLNLLERTSASDVARLAKVRANLDRWRWMPQQLGAKHVFANVPEFRLRVFANKKILANYPVIAGKRSTQTPSISAAAQGVVIHPPWYLPRSIINESVGALIARSPSTAKARGYVWTGSGKTLQVTQQPGPNSALGTIKVDMPNAEAIFVHDTPARHLFAGENKLLSHGCLRTDRAMELGILLGILQGGGTAEELAELIKKGKTEKVPFKENIPVYITYFTVGSAVDGSFRIYDDVYDRDAAVIATFAKPRSALREPPAAAASQGGGR